MCAFRAIRRDALLALGMREMTYGWNLEMQMKAASLGLRTLEIPLPYARRAGGRSKVAGSLSGTFRAGSRILLTFLRVALHSERAPGCGGATCKRALINGQHALLSQRGQIANSRAFNARQLRNRAVYVILIGRQCCDCLHAQRGC